jgi:hypothetical protein
LRRAAGLATQSVRPLPNFLIIGAQRSGTTSLFSYLSRHPAVGAAMSKEVHYFDQHLGRGLGWYRSHFPLPIPGRVVSAVGEATPYYIFHPLVPRRVHEFNSEIRLIAILRDPVERAISQYQHERSVGRETLSISEAIAREPERLEGEEERIAADPSYVPFNHRCYSYVARGRYKEQLERWHALFPREQLLVLSAESLFGEPEATVNEVLAFLGLRQITLPSYPRRNALAYEGADPAVVKRLREILETPNRELFAYLGRDFDWS